MADDEVINDEECMNGTPRRRVSLEPPVVPSRGKVIDLTSDEIYELIDFP